MKYEPSLYLGTDWFEDRNAQTRNREVKIVTTRVEHKCEFDNCLKDDHVIPKGAKAIRDKCILDGYWCSSYVCFECADEWLDEIYSDSEDAYNSDDYNEEN